MATAEAVQRIGHELTFGQNGHERAVQIDFTVVESHVRSLLQLSSFEQLRAARDEVQKDPHVRIAVIGAGVGGLKAAEMLAEAGYVVDVYEAESGPGGKVLRDVPRYKAGFISEWEGELLKQLSHPNINFIPNTGVGEDDDLSWEELVKEGGYKAVIAAIGAGNDRHESPGGTDLVTFDGRGHYYSGDFMEWANEWIGRGNRVGAMELGIDEKEGILLVEGGGLVAIDCVDMIQAWQIDRALMQLGIQEVDTFKLIHKPRAALEELYKAESKDGEVFRALMGEGIEFARGENDVLIPLLNEKLGLRDVVMIYRKETDNLSFKDAKAANAIKAYQRIHLFRFQEKREIGEVVSDNGELVGVQLVEREYNGREIVAEYQKEEHKVAQVLTAFGSVRSDVKIGEHLIEQGEVYEHEGTGYLIAGNASANKGDADKSAADAKEMTEKVLIYLRQDGMLPTSEQWQSRQAFVYDLQKRANYDGNPVATTLKYIHPYTLRFWEWLPDEAVTFLATKQDGVSQGAQKTVDNLAARLGFQTVSHKILPDGRFEARILIPEEKPEILEDSRIIYDASKSHHKWSLLFPAGYFGEIEGMTDEQGEHRYTWKGVQRAIRFRMDSRMFVTTERSQKRRAARLQWEKENAESATNVIYQMRQAEDASTSAAD